MFSKIEDFVEHNRLEQTERLAGRIPSYEEYMRIRYGVTGVRMFSLLLEYIYPLSTVPWPCLTPGISLVVANETH